MFNCCRVFVEAFPWVRFKAFQSLACVAHRPLMCGLDLFNFGPSNRYRDAHAWAGAGRIRLGRCRAFAVAKGLSGPGQSGSSCDHIDRQIACAAAKRQPRRRRLARPKSIRWGSQSSRFATSYVDRCAALSSTRSGSCRRTLATTRTPPCSVRVTMTPGPKKAHFRG